ncbi:leucine-rich repeat-containing protein 74B-like [Mizuhopecten yessoensis]|uniref:leucine-rich repeat-containing protein 74B-like n=1 Tax=Mizuhopecten yessoensis TaxID=6573 RepID=UPI000B45ADBC|nr:leucine-rich repeat-containing protein 74B-like [Mizuhopecten yessoensis]
MTTSQQARTVVPGHRRTEGSPAFGARSVMSGGSMGVLSRTRLGSGQSDLYLTELPRNDEDEETLGKFQGDHVINDNERKKKKLEQSEVKKEIYKRECARCHVVPVSAYLRAPSSSSLVIRHYNLGPNGAKALSAPLMLDDTVTHVDIVGNAIEVQGLVSLLQAITENRSVRHLDISDNNLTSTGAKVLGEFIRHNKNTTLEHLVMSATVSLLKFQLDPKERELDDTVTHVDIVGNAIEVQGLVSLLQAITENRSVRHLDISDNNLTSTGAKVLGEFIRHNKNTTLEHLVMSENCFKDEDGLYFSEAIQVNKSLKEIVLSHNLFGDVSGPAFGKALAINNTLETFDISWNQIRKKSAALFVKRLKDNVGLTRLNLGFNGLGSDGASEMVSLLKINKSLVELDLSHNRLKDLDTVPLAKGLAKNDTLKVLRIGDNLLTSVGATAILHSLYDPRSLCVLETLDFHNTSVDLAFERYLKEIKVNRAVQVIHGKVMMVGDPPQPIQTYIRLRTQYQNSTDNSRNKPKDNPGTNTMTARR